MVFLPGLLFIYHEIAYRFSLSNIRFEETSFSPKVFDHLRLTSLQFHEIQRVLNQKFHYLGKGNQSYAFESEDSRYVLKFFKFGHLKPSFFFPTAKIKSQEKRFLKVFEGYHIAYTEDPENCALLFVHLNKTDDLKKKVTLTDKFGFEHLIDLDSVIFALQEKVIPTKQVFTAAFEAGDIDGVNQRIKQIFALYLSQYKKGLYDRDHNLMYNTGFKGEKAIRLDVGKLRKDPSFKNFENYKKDLEKIAFERILKWVKNYYPHYESQVTLILHKQLEEL